ncbi:MAG: STAS domain-containing protein [bacterium]
MNITKEYDGQVVLIKLDGKILSGADANQIHQMIHEELELDHGKFILDMFGVSLINSSGVGILIGALTAARNQTGDLRLVGISQKVADVLRMMKLDQVFQTYPTFEDGKQSYLLDS